MNNVDKLNIAIHNYAYIKQAFTRAGFLRLMLQAPAAVAVGPSALKNLAKSKAKEEAAILVGNKAIRRVTGVDMLPIAFKARANANLIDNFISNNSVNRRDFLKKRLTDTALGYTPLGYASKSILPMAPSLATSAMKTIGSAIL
jgi:hypothetical protein